jgi:hypothetical protein
METKKKKIIDLIQRDFVYEQNNDKNRQILARKIEKIVECKLLDKTISDNIVLLEGYDTQNDKTIRISITNKLEVNLNI